MSVAFRRDSDEEHREPRFELPIPPGPNLVTPAGLAKTEARIAELEQAVAAETDATRLADLQRSLRYWKTRLATAQLAPTPRPGVVGIGSRVTFSHAGAVRTLTLVGHDEADPEHGLVAFSAPLARALIGASVGDSADFAGEEDALEVVDIDAS